MFYFKRTRPCAGKLFFILLLLFSLVTPGMSAATGRQQTRPRSDVRQPAPLKSDYLPGTLVVKLAAPGQEAAFTREASLYRKIQGLQVTGIRQAFPELNGKTTQKTHGLENVYYLKYNDNRPATDAAAVLAADPHVVYAEPLYLYHLTVTPNDPSYGSMPQFNLIHAPQAWDVIKGDSGNVIIAIVDGGTDWQHEDLLGNVWTNPGEVPGNGIDDDNNGYVDDVHGWNFGNNSNDPTGFPNTPLSAAHGTHTAGTAAAVTDNGVGVASISWNCTLMPVNAASATNDNSIAFGYDGIVYAAANGADVINCSWGGPFGGQLGQDVIDYAHDQGALVVAAAGNGGSDGIGDNNDETPFYPANFRHVLAVGATFATVDIKATFSNYGTTVPVYAPGVSILSTTPGNGYQASGWSGTSMASPLAAGLAGLVKTRHPGWSNDQVKEQVRVTADNMDALNPTFAGLLGNGRINAERAVSDTTVPSLRVLSVAFTDMNGDSMVDAGDTADVAITFINYLAPVSGVSLNLSVADTNVQILNGGATIASLGTLDSVTVHFEIAVSLDINSEHFRFKVDMTSPGYTDTDYFDAFFRPQMFTHDTGPLQTSVTAEGNIGYRGFAGESAGVGFVLNGQNYLFEGGLMVGTGIATVSDCIRGSDGATEDDDFRRATGELLTASVPGQFASEETHVVLVDSQALSPIGVSIDQQTFADTSASLNHFVIYKYTLTNLNSSDISNLYAGLFFDWDISVDVKDHVRFDPARGMGIAQDQATGPTNLAATLLLTPNNGLGFRAINNETELYDGFTLLEKWNFLSGGIQVQTLDGVDISTLLSTGPISLAPQGQEVVAFALIGANSQAELLSYADSARAWWDGHFTGITPPDGAVPARFELSQNYPNPFNPVTRIDYTVPKQSPVTIAVYNLLGQRVRTLVNGTQPAGRYHIDWNGRNDAGRPVASGIYLYKITAGDFSAVRKMILMK